MSTVHMFQLSVLCSALLASIAWSMPQGDPASSATAFGLTAEEEKVLTAKADEGNPESALRLYRYHEMVRLNRPDALKWLKKSAENGSPQGQYILGFFYRNDPKMNDPALAKYWLEKSAANGYGPAKDALK